MSDALESVRLKVARAEEHLEALRAECSSYLDGRPYEPIRQPHTEDADENLLVWRVHRPPPLRLSVLLGDMLHK